MWYLKESHGRREATKLPGQKALWLEEHKGGKAVKFHTPNQYTGKPFAGDHFEEDHILAYISNVKPIYSYPLIEVLVDGKVIVKVTRKEDAIKIMHALKRDYKNVIVRYNAESSEKK